MFFEMYDRKGAEVADIIKDAAKDDATKGNESAQPEVLRDRVQALNRRQTIKIQDAEINAINNEMNDDY